MKIKIESLVEMIEEEVAEAMDENFQQYKQSQEAAAYKAAAVAGKELDLLYIYGKDMGGEMITQMAEDFHRSIVEVVNSLDSHGESALEEDSISTRPRTADRLKLGDNRPKSQLAKNQHWGLKKNEKK